MDGHGASAPILSIVIPTSLHAAGLPATIRSAGPGRSSTIECVVVAHDGSTADADALGDRYPGLTVVRHADEERWSDAVNAAIEAAHGTWVCVLHAGDRVFPHALEAALGVASGSHDAVAIRGEVVVRDGLDSMWVYRTGPVDVVATLRDHLHQPGPAMVYRRAEVLAIGGVRVPYRDAWDLDLPLRIGAQGPILDVPKLLGSSHPDRADRSSFAGLSRRASECVAVTESFLAEHGSRAGLDDRVAEQALRSAYYHAALIMGDGHTPQERRHRLTDLRAPALYRDPVTGTPIEGMAQG